MGRTNLDVALLWAEVQGIPVFPCVEDGPRAKAPYTPNGHRDATLDATQIRAWWKQWPGALVGSPLADDLIAIDCDSYHDDFELKGPLAPTFVVTTPSGGRHHVYRAPAGVDLRASQTALGTHVEVKGLNKGYVILAGSRLPDGRTYQKANGVGFADAAPLDAWVVDLLTRPAADDQGHVDSSDERIWRWLREAGIGKDELQTATRAGKERHKEWFHIARAVFERFYSEDTVRKVLQWLDSRAAPSSTGLEDRSVDIEKLVESAAKKGLHGEPEDPGVVEPARYAIEMVDTGLWVREEPPPADWLVHPWLVKGDACVLAGHPGGGKSLIRDDLAFALANGGKWLGRHRAAQTDAVVVLDFENPERRQWRRFKHFHEPGMIAPGYALGPRPFQIDGWKHLQDTLPDGAVLMIDSLSKFAPGYAINDNDDMTEFFSRYLIPLRDEKNATILIVHHLRKTSEKVDLQSMRGAGAIADNVDSAWILQVDNGRRLLEHHKTREDDGLAETLAVHLEKGRPRTPEDTLDKRVGIWIRAHFGGAATTGQLVQHWKQAAPAEVRGRGDRSLSNSIGRACSFSATVEKQGEVRGESGGKTTRWISAE